MGNPIEMSPSNSNQMLWSPWHERMHTELKAKPNLLPEGSCLLLSISGGQDSMALLKLLTDLKRLHKWDIKIWHGDHGWHQSSQEIALELNQWCIQQGFRFYYDKTNKAETKTEAKARSWRYKQLILRTELITSKQKHCPCRHVVTGHTATDRAETLLLNLARGSDLAGLSSLHESRVLAGEVQLVRPMIKFSRHETAQICAEMQLPIWLDPSNNDITLSRNRVRHEILPVLEDLHPGCSVRMATLSEKLKHHKDDQQALALLALKTLSNSEGLCRKSLYKLPISARSTILATWLKKTGAPALSAKQLHDLSIKISKSKPPGCVHLPKGWKVSWMSALIKLQHPN